MLARGFAAGPWGTNCFIVAPAEGSECLIIDPGKDSIDMIDAVVAEHRLHPVAVLLTHGHIDHTWSVVPLCSAHDIPGYIHGSDRAQLNDPLPGLSAETRDVMARMAGGAVPSGEPADVRLLGDGDGLELAGLPLTVRHAPGHTPGSVAFVGRDTTAEVDVMFSGDLLFAGSIGRVDLPGGDWDDMVASLQRVVLPMADDTVVLPGHGGATTIGQERQFNPYLAEAAQAPQGRGL